MKKTLGARVAAPLLAACVTALHAAPFTPAGDDEIVQKLPAGWDAAARRQRAELSRDPSQLPLALATARAATVRARQGGDPRELGLAQAALAPWWSLPEPPAAVRLLRASVRQSQHDFAAALADLDALAVDRRAPLPVQAQAGLTRATVLQVTGRLAEAAAACDALLAPHFAPLGAPLSVAARACGAELRSLQGERQRAADELAALAREAPRDRWLALVRAELAQRMGDAAAAGARFREAATADADVYTLAAYADWLLESGQARAALQVLDAHEADADALLLRRAIALHRLHDPQAGAAAQALAARFDAARLRGESLHAREEARLALEVLDEPARALSLARENWQRQKEPADAVLLWRSALAAGQPAAAQALKAWARDPAAVDVRLAALTQGAQP